MVKKVKITLASIAAFTLAVSVAVPIGVIYGRPVSATTPQVDTSQAVFGSINVTNQNPLPNKFKIGTVPSEFPVPSMVVDGHNFNPDDYEEGVFSESNITSETKIGSTNVHITFIYKPKKGKNGPTYIVTFPLVIAR